MNHQQYKHIRSSDRPQLQTVLNELEQLGLEARLEGSAKESCEYGDIDLLIESANPSDANRLYLAVQRLESDHGAIVQGTQREQSISYVGGVIHDRYRLNLDQTAFDLCYRPARAPPAFEKETASIARYKSIKDE